MFMQYFINIFYFYAIQAYICSAARTVSVPALLRRPGTPPSFGISPKFFVGCSKSIANGRELWYSYISNDTFFCQYSLKRTIF